MVRGEHIGLTENGAKRERQKLISGYQGREWRLGKRERLTKISSTSIRFDGPSLLLKI